mmetsp:Transcript_4136/g.7594  ORF Transcript_4136/g.7594 Transcript_4136/m.7594 type:complete len:246 (-) Transcript_4136:500-1237(-)
MTAACSKCTPGGAVWAAMFDVRVFSRSMLTLSPIVSDSCSLWQTCRTAAASQRQRSAARRSSAQSFSLISNLRQSGVSIAGSRPFGILPRNLEDRELICFLFKPSKTSDSKRRTFATAPCHEDTAVPDELLKNSLCTSQLLFRRCKKALGRLWSSNAFFISNNERPGERSKRVASASSPAGRAATRSSCSRKFRRAANRKERRSRTGSSWKEAVAPPSWGARTSPEDKSDRPNPQGSRTSSPASK